MPLCCWRSRPACPPWLGGRRPRRRLFLPPPPEGCPGPTFIIFSFLQFCLQSARRGDLILTRGTTRRAVVQGHRKQVPPSGGLKAELQKRENYECRTRTSLRRRREKQTAAGTASAQPWRARRPRSPAT